MSEFADDSGGIVFPQLEWGCSVEDIENTFGIKYVYPLSVSDLSEENWVTFSLNEKQYGGIAGFRAADEGLISVSIPLKVVDNQDYEAALDELLAEFTELLGEPEKADEPHISSTSYSYNWRKEHDSAKTLLRLIVEKSGASINELNILVGKLLEC